VQQIAIAFKLSQICLIHNADTHPLVQAHAHKPVLWLLRLDETRATSGFIQQRMVVVYEHLLNLQTHHIQSTSRVYMSSGQSNGEWVLAVDFSPNSMQIACGGEDKAVRIWDTRTGHETAVLDVDRSTVTSVAFSFDGTYIVSCGGDDKIVQLWNINTGQQRTIDQHPDSTSEAKVRCVAFSPDGTQIVSGSHDGSIQLWDVNTGKLVSTLYSWPWINRAHSDVVSSVSFSPDGNFILSSSWDHTVRVWHGTTYRNSLFVMDHTVEVYSAAFTPNGHEIVSGGQDGILRIWNLEMPVNSSRELASSGAIMCSGHKGPIQSVTCSPNGWYIASGSSDKTIRLWRAATGVQISVFDGHINSVMSVAFSPDSRYIASGSADGSVRLWDVSFFASIANASSEHLVDSELEQDATRESEDEGI
jgi:WD40 repeat protein